MTGRTPQRSGAISRRDLLRQAANGFAMLPFADLLARQHNGGALVRHHAPRARSVIFLYMDGAPSCQDLFDYKRRRDAERAEALDDLAEMDADLI